MLFMTCLAALPAGLILGFRELFAYLAAQRSGVIVRRGHHRIRIDRAADPDRFARLLANRSKGAGAGFGVTLAGALGLVVLGGESSGPLILGVVLYLGIAGFAVYCLVRGFLTGRMFAFWSLTLFGEAPRKGNPVWFWTYAALNLVVALFALLSLIGVIVG